MLAELKFAIESESGMRFVPSKGSLFQGVIMQLIDPDYAELLHNQGIRPYSQYVKTIEDKSYWCIRTLNKEAYEKIILPMCEKEIDSVTIEHNDEKILLKDKKLITVPFSNLIDEFYESDAGCIYDIEFLTPTSFKRDGRYSFYPEVYAIYNSLMKKMDSVTDQSMISHETLDQLSANSEIVGYNLKSVAFGVEGVKIPSFIGRITIRIRGPQTMNNFARMLFEFGDFSGVGIKNAMGMGAIKVQERKRGERKA